MSHMPSVSGPVVLDPTRGIFSVKDYGAKGDGATDDAAAFGLAIAAAAATSNGVYGSIVYVPRGLYIIGSQLVIPNGVGLCGSGPASTILKAKSTFSDTSLITNENQDGTQEYAFLESLMIDANKGGGAVCSVAAVNLISLFINSYLRDVIIVNSSNVGLRIASANGMGPVFVENTWVISSDGHNVLVEEIAGNTESSVGICFINLTSEHQASGKAAIYLKGLGYSYQWNFFSTHIEMTNGGAGTRAVVIDGVGHVLFKGLQIHSGNTTGVTAIEITNSAQNVGIQLHGVTNVNLINPVLADAKSSYTVGAQNLPIYTSPDVGLTAAREGYQLLTYGTSIAVDVSNGNYCEIDVSDGVGFTILDATNAHNGTTLTFEIVNASGGAMGVITWGALYAFRDSSWTNPANGARRLITFKKRNGGWAQLSPATGDM